MAPTLCQHVIDAPLGNKAAAGAQNASLALCYGHGFVQPAGAWAGRQPSKPMRTGRIVAHGNDDARSTNYPPNEMSDTNWDLMHVRLQPVRHRNRIKTSFAFGAITVGHITTLGRLSHFF